jgi:hypothetical protein
VRERVGSDFTAFTTDERTTRSFFTSINESWQGQRLEASWRYDDDEQFGRRNTGSVGYGLELSGYTVAATVGRGFRAPTFLRPLWTGLGLLPAQSHALAREEREPRAVGQVTGPRASSPGAPPSTTTASRT